MDGSLLGGCVHRTGVSKSQKRRRISSIGGSERS